MVLPSLIGYQINLIIFFFIYFDCKTQSQEQTLQCIVACMTAVDVDRDIWFRQKTQKRDKTQLDDFL